MPIRAMDEAALGRMLNAVSLRSGAAAKQRSSPGS